MYTYVQRPGCKKENKATYVYIRAGSRTPTRAYLRPWLVYMAGSERRNSVIVVFMGRQRNASCSSGGLGRSMRWKRGLVYRTTEETDLLHSKRGPVDREGCGVPQNVGNGPPTIETGVLLIGRGVAYRKTDETDLLRSKRGSCSSGGVWRTAKWTPRDTVHLHRRPPPTSTGYR